MDARAYVESHAREFIDDLKQWLAIPSISADPAHHGDVRRSAGWLAAHLTSIGFPVAEVFQTAPGGLPAVFAEWPAADPAAPKVLIYGHHDVQPVEPLEEWESPPGAVSHVSATGKPMARRCAASHSALRRTSPCRAGSAETDGMASHCFRSSMNSRAWDSTYARASMT